MHEGNGKRSVGEDVSGSPEWAGLERFLAAEIYAGASGVRIADVARPQGGASWDTFLIDVEIEREGLRERLRVVVRRAPESGPMAPYEVHKDVAILSALEESDVPVPRLLGWSVDPAVFDRQFIVMDFVAGESHDITQVERWPRWQQDRTLLGNEIIDTLASLHRFEWRGTPIEGFFGSAGTIGERVCGLLDSYFEPLLALAGERERGLPLWRELASWLRQNVPDSDDDDLVLVHGDYRFGNFLWRDAEIAAVHDWERASLGHRMQELGFICMPLSRLRDPQIMGKALPFDALAERYERASGLAVDIAKVQYFAVLWQMLEAVNALRSGLEDPIPLVATVVVAQPNLVARQMLQLIEDLEAGRPAL